MFDLNGLRVWVAGHAGMVGAAVAKELRQAGAERVIGWRSREVDLTDRDATVRAARNARPDAVVLAAGRVGGIPANLSDPVGFLTENLRIQTNVMEAAHLVDVDRLLLIGSSVVYPRESERPMDPGRILTGTPDPDRIGYAMAKLAGLTMIQSYRSQFSRRWIAALPTNIYGPGDDFSPDNAHVIPSLIRRFSESVASGVSKTVLWGTGTTRRQFLHVDDFARACIRLLEDYDKAEAINVGPTEDIAIAEIAQLIAAEVGFDGQIFWDATRPDGAPRRLLDVRHINQLGWSPTVTISNGVEQMVKYFNCYQHGTKK